MTQWGVEAKVIIEAYEAQGVELSRTESSNYQLVFRDNAEFTYFHTMMDGRMEVSHVIEDINSLTRMNPGANALVIKMTRYFVNAGVLNLAL